MLRGCPPKNRPLNSDQNFDFLQNFSMKQGLYKVTYISVVFILDNHRDFEENVIDTQNPQIGPFTKPKLALIEMLAAKRIFSVRR